MRIYKHLKGPASYSFANIISAASGFFLVPLLTRTMNPNGMAAWIIFEPALTLFGQFLMLGLGHAVLQQICESELRRKDVLNSHLQTLISVSLCVVLVGLAASTIFNASSIIPFSFNVTTEIMLGYMVYYARATNDLRLYFISAVARPLLLVLSWASWVYFFMGPAWLMQGASVDTFLWLRFTIAAIILVATCGWLFFRNNEKIANKGSFDKHLVYSAAKFGIPLTIASALVALQDFVMRYLLLHFVQRDALLDYYVHLKAVALVGNFVVAPLAIWWGAERYRAMTNGSSYFQERVNGVMLRSCALYGLLCAIFLAVLPWIITVFSPGMRSNTFLAVLLLAVPFTQMLTHLTNAGLMREGVTKYQILVQLLSLSVVSIGCIGLIEWMAIGVAGASLLANVVAFSCSYFLSIKFYSARYSILKCTLVFIIFFIAIYVPIEIVLNFARSVSL